MVAYYLNCLICGCGWGKEVITDTELMKKHFTPDDILECPTNTVEEGIDCGKISKKIGVDLQKSIKNLPNHKWLNDVITVQPGKIVDVELQMDDSYTVFDKAGKEYFFYSFDVDRENYKEKAYIMHKNCYTLLKNNGFNVSYQSFSDIDGIQPIKRTKLSKQHIETNRFDMDYGIADKYIGEYGVFYEHSAYIWDPYLLEDPLTNKQNADRIMSLNFPLKKVAAEIVVTH